MTKLLSKWRSRSHHQGEVFIADGAIDTKRWKNTSRKVLLLLKEAYGEKDGKSWDLCTRIRDSWKGPKYKIWWTVSYWAYGLQNMKRDIVPPFPDNDPNYTEAKEAFFCTAIVNIKKSRGRSSSGPDDLAKYVRLDGDLIKQQVESLKPDIVVCGSTWHYVSMLWPNASKIHPCVYVSGNIAFVDFWHPANFYPDELNYYALCGIVQSAQILR